MKFNLLGSTANLNISIGNAAHYIKRLDIPALDSLYCMITLNFAVISVTFLLFCSRA